MARNTSGSSSMVSNTDLAILCLRDSTKEDQLERLVTTTLHPALRNVADVIFDVGGTLVHPDWRRLGEIVTAETERRFTPVQMYEAFYAMLQAADADLIAGTRSADRSGAH